MKLKLFVGGDTRDVERQVNAWRKESPGFEIIKSETTISYHSIPDPSGANQLQQRISIAIWYAEGPSASLSPMPPHQPRTAN